MRHLSYHPPLRTCSSDTILRVIGELTQGNISYTSDHGKTYDFNTADKLNTLLINALVSTGELREMEEYDVDFDHQFLETEKYDAKPTYKKFLGYRPGVYVIGDKIVYIENSNGLIRQYIPKGSDFTNITQEFLEEVERKLNERPRKRHGFLSPNQVFSKSTELDARAFV